MIGITATEAVPDALPLIAVIVAVPPPTAVTTPVAETVATPVLLLLHVIGASGITVPDASFAVAVSDTLSPMASVLRDGPTVIDATGGGRTTMVAVPGFPSLVAVIVADPAATPVTKPLASTLAMLGELLDQVNVRLASGLCWASNAAAVSCTVPERTMVSSGGETDTDDTGGGSTLIVAMPDAPPALAAIFTCPAATPVTTPAPETVAMDALPVFQNTCCPATTCPPGLMTVACSVIDPPTATLSVSGDTVIEPTDPLLGEVLDAHDASAAAASTRRMDRRTPAGQHERIMAAG